MKASENIVIEEGSLADKEDITLKIRRYSFERLPYKVFPYWEEKIIVARDSQGLIGGAVATLFRRHTAELNKLWVRADTRGKGLGTDLLGKIEEWVKSEGGKVIYFQTAGLRQVSFYKRHGYRVLGSVDDCAAVDYKIYFM